MKIPERIGYGKCKKCGRMHSTARFACLANRKERAMRLGINSSGTPVGENKPTYAQLESENARLRQAMDRANLAFELYAKFGYYHPNTGSGAWYSLTAEGTKISNDDRVYPISERFELLTIDNVINCAFVLLGRGGTFSSFIYPTDFDGRLSNLL